MAKRLLLALQLFIILFCPVPTDAQSPQPRFRALVFYSTHTEHDHVVFAQDALKFLSSLAGKDQFQVDTTTSWDDLNDARLQPYQLVIWLNESPAKEDQRLAFQRYMEHGGAWLGFHASGYNDKDTGWPWYVDFLGGAVFSINSWPPLPARLVVDPPRNPVTANLPDSYIAPQNEWYVWKPDPRANPDVRVLLTLDPANYPLGLKDVILAGDCPVVWTNTKYKMLYTNMGHGGKILSDATQNQLIENAVLWLGTGAGRMGYVLPDGVRISPQAVVANLKTNKIYAVNSDDNTLTVLTGRRDEFKKVTVGKRPSTIGVNPATNRIYVANQEDGTVSVVDGNEDRVLTTVKVGDLPYVISVNPASNKIYVSKTFSNTTTLIDGATNEVRMLKTGVEATTMTSSAELNKSYITDLGDTLTVLDGSTDAASKIHLGTRTWGLAVNPLTNKVYVGDAGDCTLTIIDGKTGTFHAVQVGEMPTAIAIDSAANRIYVTNYVGNSVSIIDGANDAVLATIPVGARPQAIAVDSTTHTVYAANTGGHSVSVISGKTNNVVGTVDVGAGPYSVAVSNGLAYVKRLGDDALLAIDPKALSAIRVDAR
jgi:uncharacterized protein